MAKAKIPKVTVLHYPEIVEALYLEGKYEVQVGKHFLKYELREDLKIIGISVSLGNGGVSWANINPPEVIFGGFDSLNQRLSSNEAPPIHMTGVDDVELSLRIPHFNRGLKIGNISSTEEVHKPYIETMKEGAHCRRVIASKNIIWLSEYLTEENELGFVYDLPAYLSLTIVPSSSIQNDGMLIIPD